MTDYRFVIHFPDNKPFSTPTSYDIYTRLKDVPNLKSTDLMVTGSSKKPKTAIQQLIQASVDIYYFNQIYRLNYTKDIERWVNVILKDDAKARDVVADVNSDPNTPHITLADYRKSANKVIKALTGTKYGTVDAYPFKVVIEKR